MHPHLATPPCTHIEIRVVALGNIEQEAETTRLIKPYIVCIGERSYPVVL